MKKVLVACGGAVATSTVAADKIRTFCQLHHIEVDVQQCRIQEIAMRAADVDLIVTTARVTTDYGTPVIHGIAFISGINLEATEQKVLDALSS